MHEFLRTVQLKLERAAMHLTAIKTLRENLVANAPELRITPEYSDDRRTVRFLLSGTREGALDEISLHMSECVHMLRSSLDNLIFSAARLKCDPPINPGAIAFPIVKNKNDYYDRTAKTREQIPDRAAEIVERVQPFRTSPNSPLILLQRLSNDDKHRTPVVSVFVPAGEQTFDLNLKFYSEEATDEGPPETIISTDPWFDGLALITVKTQNSVKEAAGRWNFGLSFQFQLDGDWLGLVDALDGVHQTAREIIDKIRPLFEPA
jgi:hypothetical protein